MIKIYESEDKQFPFIIDINGKKQKFTRKAFVDLYEYMGSYLELEPSDLKCAKCDETNVCIDCLERNESEVLNPDNTDFEDYNI